MNSNGEPEDLASYMTYEAAKEIYTTEKSFNRILHLLYDEFRVHILDSNVVPEFEFETIFGNIATLAPFSDTLLEKLKARIENWNVGSSKVADIFVEMGPFIK